MQPKVSRKILPMMTDEQAAKARARMIETGQLVPSTKVYEEDALGYTERPPMGRELVNRLQKKLIKMGILMPNYKRH